MYYMRDEYFNAEEFYVQSRDLFFKIGDQLQFAQSLEGLGRVHTARREYAKAAESFIKAQRIYHQIGDRYPLVSITLGLGHVHRDQGEFDEAERLVREASTIFGELGLSESAAHCDEILAQIHLLIEIVSTL